MVQRVLVVENCSLFGAGLESLLAQYSDFNVVGCVPQNEAELMRLIKEMNPQVIILHDTSFMKNPMELITRLRVRSKLRLLLVSKTKNSVNVFDSQSIVVTSKANLSELIRQKQA